MPIANRARMNVLFIGDIVGPRAVAWVARRLFRLRADYDVDLVIANAENCAPSGTAMSVRSVRKLLAHGVDVVTGGNHSWEGEDAPAVLADPRVLRPVNVRAGLAGRGVVTIDVGGEAVTVLNVADVRTLGADVREGATPPYQTWGEVERRGTTIVDFHGDHVIEKQVFAHALDGEVAAVLGTHSHEPTLRLDVLPQGTGFVTDVGMTGPLGGVQGFDPRRFVAALKHDGRYLAPPLPKPARGPIALGAVVLDIADGRTARLERIDGRIAGRAAPVNGARPGRRPAAPLAAGSADR